MTLEERKFMNVYAIQAMEISCENDSCFVATFISEDNQKFEFKMTKQKVMEHIERTCSHVEMYLMNKRLVEAHFKRMARTWYAMTRVKVKV